MVIDRVHRSSLRRLQKTGVLLLLTLSATNDVLAESAKSDNTTPDGLAIAQRIADRDEGTSRTQNVRIVMRNRRGKERTREAKIFRRTDDEARRTALFYERPSDVRGTGFLTLDYPAAGRDDDQWLYLPSLKRVRRISASERGDWFMATDLTYEDVKKDGKFEVEEAHWSRLEDESVDGHDCFVIEGELKTEELTKQLGHAKVRVWVDRDIDYPRRVEYLSADGAVLRSVQTTKIEQVQGVWTAVEIEARNSERGTSSSFVFTATDYESELSDRVFSQAQLERGAPR